ncbi:MAG: SLBB domain-containing protein, partial [Lentisphaeria bacterium]|nr:SLBB domain-containing protein [Lentisphaeria bacterium]
VFGEVNKPGEVELSENTNIFEALAKAGGPNLETASLSIHITRQTKQGPISMNFDLRDGIGKLTNPAECGKTNCHQGIPYIQAGDVIWVDRKNGLALKWWIDLIWKLALFGIFVEASLNFAGTS